MIGVFVKVVIYGIPASVITSVIRYVKFTSTYILKIVHAKNVYLVNQLLNTCENQLLNTDETSLDNKKMWKKMSYSHNFIGNYTVVIISCHFISCTYY